MHALPLSSPLRRPVFWVWASILFIYIFYMLLHSGDSMFGDTDPLWHMAAGKAIRDGGFSLQDHWSYTAGDYGWLNISWLWDMGMSWVKDTGGWETLVVINAITIALMIVCIYAHCALRSGNLMVSAIIAMGAMMQVAIGLRPMQLTTLFVAMWLLILGQYVRGQMPRCALLLLPASILVWVNMHGGVVTAPVILGAFLAQALWQRSWPVARQLFVAGLFCSAAFFCNPYGVRIIEAIFRPLQEHHDFILEWQPLTLKMADLPGALYVLAFLPLVLNRKLPILAAERWLAYAWLIMSITVNRNLSVFAVLAAAPMACSVAAIQARLPEWRLWNTARTAMLKCYDHKIVAVMGVSFCVATSAIYLARAQQSMHEPKSIPIWIADELIYLADHYPKGVRLMNQYNLGGIMAFGTSGAVPTFIDARAGTVFPPEVIDDYVSFNEAHPGYEELFDKYHIDGVFLPNNEWQLIDRFTHRVGWTVVFAGPEATIVMRDKPGVKPAVKPADKTPVKK